MNLDLVRKQLDIYDNIIKNMLTLRMSLIPLVAEIKMENNFPLHQSKREDEIYHNIEIFSKENGIDKDLVKNIYKLMISNALKIEEEFVNNPNDTILNKKTDYSNSESIKEYFQK